MQELAPRGLFERGCLGHFVIGGNNGVVAVSQLVGDTCRLLIFAPVQQEPY